jgi:hypothetical protein
MCVRRIAMSIAVKKHLRETHNGLDSVRAAHL